MADFEVFVPKDYEVVETDEVVKSETVVVYLHLFERVANRHAAQLNAERIGPLFRWEVERIKTKELRKRYGRLGRWAVVPYQNVLRKIDKN